MGQLLNYFKRSPRGKLVFDARTALKVFTDEAKNLDREGKTNLNEGKNAEKLGNRGYSFHRELEIGKLYIFTYPSPKTKNLKWFDAHPLVFPISVEASSFLGLNLHYLPTSARIILLDALLDLSDRPIPNGGPIPKNITIAASYQILKSFARFKYVKPTIHRYMFNLVGSKFRNIESDLWLSAAILPTYRFQKATATTVWDDSMRQVEGLPNTIQPKVTKAIGEK